MLPVRRQSCPTRNGAIELIVPLALLVCLLAHYPGWIAYRASLGQYFDGVYRSRVLARELILGIANGVDALVGTKGKGPQPGFAAGWVIVTGGGFVVTWWLLRRHRREHAPSIGPLELVVAAAMVTSARVLTPYDFLSYALIVATVVAARSERTIATAAFAASAVATRESGLFVVAIIAASCVVNRPEFGDAWRSTWLGAKHHRPLWAALISSVATYAILKLALRQAGGVVLFQQFHLRSNLTVGSAWGITLAVGLLAAERWAAGPLRAEDRTRRHVLWLLALPYFAVLFIGASWDEAPRLVMPLVIGEALLVMHTSSVRHGATERRSHPAASSRPPTTLNETNERVGP